MTTPIQIFYTLDEENQPVLATDLEEWAKWFESGEGRRVATTLISHLRVSTVFLGMDQALGRAKRPVLFETTVFGEPLDGYVRRYHTWEEAEAGHAELVDRIYARLPPERSSPPIRPE